MEETPLLDVFDLGFGYGKTRVWDHADLTLYAGDIGFLVGPNGAGKTTLLKCLAGWMRPAAGSVRLLGEELTGSAQHLRAEVAFVPDVPAFYDDMTAREHLSFVLGARGAGDEEQAEAAELLDAFGLARCADAYPSSYSRGMRQKLACVLAFVAHPKVLIMDEVTGPLDAPSRELLARHIRRVAAAGTAVLLSCHHDLPGVVPDAVYRLEDGSLALVEDDEQDRWLSIDPTGQAGTLSSEQAPGTSPADMPPAGARHASSGERA